MKTVILTLVVLLVVKQSEGLKCFCQGNRICSNPIDTCKGSADVCGTVMVIVGPKPSHFRRCMSSRDCNSMNFAGVSSCYSCGFDLCNGPKGNMLQIYE